MKRTIALVCSFLFAVGTFAQKGENASISATEIQGSYLGTTINLRDFEEPKDAVNEIQKHHKPGTHPKGDWVHYQKVNPNALPQGIDPLLQDNYAPENSQKILTKNWQGIAYSGVSPADPSLDVGPNHVVQMINGPSGSYIQIWDKNGNSLVNQTYFDNFVNFGATGAGDPIVVYDERADRWLISEFAPQGQNALHVAISTTPDPTGSYHKYTYSTPSFPDYPKYSVWENEYVVTTNENTSAIYVMNRTAMLAGTANNAQRLTLTNFGTIGFQAATPVSLNGTVNPPNNQKPMVMRMRDDAWAGSSSDALEMWEITIDWANSNNTTITQSQVIGVSPFDSNLGGFTSFSAITQQGSNTKLDPLREVLMNRIHYRNFGTHEAIVCCHVTDVDGNDRAGVRWYELRRTGGSGNWSIYQEGTYAPNDGHSRWMPSIGISATGNIGLAYNIASSSMYPSLRYTGRKECDPLNSMTESETVIIDGTNASQSNRWGDYNAMGLDPSDGETFWFTGMYGAGGDWQTRVAAFDIPSCSPNLQFTNSTYTQDEAPGAVNAGCLDYTIVNVPISIGSEPSAAADVTITTAGTATLGQDYTISPASFTFSGSTLSGTVEVRIYNDAYVEGAETIILGYTLNTNGGNAAAGSINQTATITINDDDLAPANMIASTQLLSHDFESGLAPFTTNNPSGNTAWQAGNNAAATSQYYTIPAASNATQFAWINDDACNCTQANVDLIFPVIDMSGYTGGSLSFDSYYENNNYQNTQEKAELSVSINGGAYTVVTPITPAQLDVAWISQNVDISAYAGNASVQFKITYSDEGGWMYGCTIDNVVVTGTAPIDVQTATNSGSGQTANLGPNSTVHFYDPTTSNVMLSLENTSNFDYGCVTVEVDRAGTSPTALQFNSASTADFVASKTFTVVPTNNNPSGTFNITTYYKEAEISAWETTTGNNRSNLEIIKIAGSNAISDVTPANYASYTIANSAATIGAFNSDVTLTAPFTTGFSGFGIGVYNIPTPQGPTAAFTQDATTVCEGSSVSFTDNSTGTPTTWAWTFGDGGTSAAQNPSYTYATAGNYTVTLTVSNANGSDVSTQTNLITVNAPVTFSQTSDLCPGQTITVGTNTYNSTGTYTDVLQASNGCDSTITTIVTVSAGITNSQTVDLCPGHTVIVGTSTYNSAGTYTDVLLASGGCDSTVSTTVNMLTPATNTLSFDICPGQSVTVGTSTYNSPGTYTDVLLAANGCDSTITSTVNMLTPSTSTQNIQLCNGQTVTVGTNTYNSNGTYTDVLQASNGCDSTVTTIVTVVTAITHSQTVDLCPGQTVTVGTNTYNSAGTYTNILQSQSGCDSTVTTTVNVLNPSTFTQSIDLCPGQNVIVGNNTYNSAGTYTDVLQASNGCDSTVTTIVNMLTPTTNSLSFNICPGETVTVGTSTYTVAGTYTDVLQGSNGCDSTITTVVTINPGVTNSQTLTICQGQSITVGTSTYTNSGTYTDVLQAASGCDSTVTTILTVTPALSSSQNLTICQGQSVSVGTSTYTIAGTYTDVFSGTGGCDSIVTTVLTVNPPVVYNQTANLCPGETITVGNNTYAAAGQFTDVLQSANGCDSIVITLVNLLAATSSNQTVHLCDGNSVTVGNNTYTNAGTYTDVLINGAGCDSTVTTIVTTGTSSIYTQTADICAGGSVTVGNNTYTTGGTYTDVLSNSEGCDSTVTTIVTVVTETTSTQNITLCQGQSLIVGNNTYDTDGTYTDVLQGSNGCDSTVTTIITVNGLPTVSISPLASDTVCLQTDIISMSGNPVGGVFSGNAVSGSAFSPSFAGTGTHILTYTFTDNNGCANNANVTLHVDDCTGILESGISNVTLFPNPNTGVFRIKGLPSNSHIQIFDAQGKLVLSTNVVDENQDIKIPNIERGVYFLKATKDGKNGTIRFVVNE